MTELLYDLQTETDLFAERTERGLQEWSAVTAADNYVRITPDMKLVQDEFATIMKGFSTDPIFKSFASENDLTYANAGENLRRTFAIKEEFMAQRTVLTSRAKLTAMKRAAIEANRSTTYDQLVDVANDGADAIADFVSLVGTIAAEQGMRAMVSVKENAPKIAAGLALGGMALSMNNGYTAPENSATAYAQEAAAQPSVIEIAPALVSVKKRTPAEHTAQLKALTSTVEEVRKQEQPRSVVNPDAKPQVVLINGGLDKMMKDPRKVATPQTRVLVTTAKALLEYPALFTAENRTVIADQLSAEQKVAAENIQASVFGENTAIPGADQETIAQLLALIPETMTNAPVEKVEPAPQQAEPEVAKIKTMAELLDAESMAKILPHADAENNKKYTPMILAALKERGIDDPLMVAYTFGTINAETSNFAPIPEWASGVDYEGREDLGNIHPGDGVRYKGRGFIQLTGRNNYRNYGAKLGLDLEGNPDLALDPETAARVLAVYLEPRAEKIRTALEHGRYARARKYVNGGTNGLDKMTESYRAALAVVAPDSKLIEESKEVLESRQLIEQLLSKENVRFGKSPNDRVRESFEDIKDDGRTFLYDVDRNNKDEVVVSQNLLKALVEMTNVTGYELVSLTTSHEHSKNSAHYDGNAIDLDGDYTAIYKFLYENRERLGINELIFGGELPEGMTNLKHGDQFSYSDGVIDGHKAHIHVSFR